MTLDGTRTYTVGTQRPVVIDPGPASADHLSRLIATLEGASPEAILLTHYHGDHSACAGELAIQTGAEIRASARTVELLDPMLEGVRIRPLEEGETIRSDEGELEVIPTPGHTPDHLSFLWRGGMAPDGGAVFVGDLLMGHGDTTLVAHPEGDLQQYLGSLDRIEAVAPARIYPTHGPPIFDPREAIKRYREHRAERIAQVRRALAEAPDSSVDALLDRVYGNALDPRLRTAAAGSLEAVVRYLRESI